MEWRKDGRVGKAGSLVVDFLGVGSTAAAEVPASTRKAAPRATVMPARPATSLDAAGNVVPSGRQEGQRRGFDDDRKADQSSPLPARK